MKTFRQIIIYGFLLFFSICSYGQIVKDECRDIDFLVKNTLDAIQKKSDTLYLKFFDFNTMTEVFKQMAITDSIALQVYNYMQKKPELVAEVVQSNFNKLLNAIEQEHEKKSWNLKYVGYYIQYTEEDTLTSNFTLILKLKSNGKKHHITMYVTKYEDCYYLFEAVTPYFSSGW